MIVDNPMLFRVFDRTKRPLPQPRDMRSWVIEADPDWSRKSVQPATYQFSNNRTFMTTQKPGVAYGT